MAPSIVDPSLAGTRLTPFEFSWTWEMTQLIARSAGCSIAEPFDRPWMLPGSDRPAHPMVLFNGALLARNRDEVMDRLAGGYDAWQEVGRWGSGSMSFLRPAPRAGRGRVRCGFSEVGATSKGHALVRFTFEIDDAESDVHLADGSMLLFLLGCGSEKAGKLMAPRITIPESSPSDVVAHDTPVNVTFDWAMASADWNTTHFEKKGDSPAPLVHGPRNMSLLLHDAARLHARGALESIRAITLGNMAAPHYPGEGTETRFWKLAADRLVGRLVVPAVHRIDGGTGDKVVIDQIEILLAPPGKNSGSSPKRVGESKGLELDQY